MKVELKITQSLRAAILTDLARPHDFAAERVGFIHCHPGVIRDGVVLIAGDYAAVADEDYVDDPTVGARIGAGAFRKALQYAYANKVSVFHIHCHDHFGIPFFSRTDLRETARFVPDFWNVRPNLPHGAFVLSRDSAVGRCWLPRWANPVEIKRIVFVGKKLEIITNYAKPKTDSAELSGRK
jgi:hypothetical protein